MIGYFSSFRWSKTQQAYVVCHKQPEMVPPPHHRETGAKTRPAREDHYILDISDDTVGDRWSTYPYREKLHWSNDFLTAGLARAILASGYTTMIDALTDAQTRTVELAPHKWYGERPNYPTLWDHLDDA